MDFVQTVGKLICDFHTDHVSYFHGNLHINHVKSIYPLENLQEFGDDFSHSSEFVLSLFGVGGNCDYLVLIQLQFYCFVFGIVVVIEC